MDGPTVLIVVLAAAFVSMVVFFAIQNGKKAGKPDGREIRSSQASRRHSLHLSHFTEERHNKCQSSFKEHHRSTPLNLIRRSDPSRRDRNSW